MRELLDRHKVNHVIIEIDESSSMSRLRRLIEQLFDRLVKDLAADSEEFDQETRVSVYVFGSRGSERCIVWDCDVLRIPSISGLYEPNGLTALVDCEHLVLDDIERIPQMYGDHAVVCYTLTDGGENDSVKSAALLRQRFAGLPGNVSKGIFVPDQSCRRYAIDKVGYDPDSVQIWNPQGTNAVEKLGDDVRATSRAFMQARREGVRGTRSLFRLGDVTAAEVKSELVPVTLGSYYFVQIDYPTQISDLVSTIGKGYYELTKGVTVQPQKQVLIETGGKVYGGPAARDLVGLPDMHVKITSTDVTRARAMHPDLRIFIQSTSVNRKLLPGTKLLVMR